jgi:serine/threonine protein phosphatase PrpC
LVFGMLQKNTPNEIAAFLSTFAQKRGSQDNVTVVIVVFDWS